MPGTELTGKMRPVYDWKAVPVTSDDISSARLNAFLTQIDWDYMAVDSVVALLGRIDPVWREKFVAEASELWIYADRPVVDAALANNFEAGIFHRYLSPQATLPRQDFDMIGVPDAQWGEASLDVVLPRWIDALCQGGLLVIGLSLPGQRLAWLTRFLPGAAERRHAAMDALADRLRAAGLIKVKVDFAGRQLLASGLKPGGQTPSQSA